MLLTFVLPLADYFLHFCENGVVTFSPVVNENTADDFQLPLHFLGVMTRPSFFLPFLMLTGLVFVFTVPTEASGALGSVLIGGIEQSRL